MTPVQPPSFPASAQEFLANWSISRGNLRKFLESTALPPIGDSAQQAAGAAAAELAVHEAFGMDLESFDSGVQSVSGSINAAGSLHVSPMDPSIPEDVGAAAFFDIDNTLIRGSSLIAFAYGLARHRYVDLRDIPPIAWKQTKYRLTGSENAHDVTAGRTQALEFIRGRSVAELTELCEEIVEERIQYQAFPGTKSLADLHLAAGQQVWLVSATPVQLAHILAKRFGFTGALGTVPEVKDGIFTGRLVGDILHGPGKTHAVAALSAMQRLDLNRCTAYSDSANDIPMLSMVGTAVAVNPDRQLRKHAERHDWQIRDYRNLRKAIRTWGVSGLLTAGFSVAGWRLRGHLPWPG